MFNVQTYTDFNIYSTMEKLMQINMQLNEFLRPLNEQYHQIFTVKPVAHNHTSVIDSLNVFVKGLALASDFSW